MPAKPEFLRRLFLKLLKWGLDHPELSSSHQVNKLIYLRSFEGRKYSLPYYHPQVSIDEPLMGSEQKVFSLIILMIGSKLENSAALLMVSNLFSGTILQIRFQPFRFDRSVVAMLPISMPSRRVILKSAMMFGSD
jgi:hypothetical protein